MGEDAPEYRDGTVADEARVTDLLQRMTTAEKVGQLVGTTPLVTGREIDEIEDAVRDSYVGTVSPTALAFTPDSGPADFAAFANRFQRVAIEETRLGIPLLVPSDAIHGYALVDGSTVFPHNLGMAATRDPALSEAIATATATEMRAVGTNQTYNPTADVAREPRWGRVLETFGESPYLCARFVEAEVTGYQGEQVDAASVAATVKHFPAYSEPSRGEDTAPVDRPPATIRRMFLPPFRAAIEAGVACTMPSYNAIDGVPVHGSERYLTDLLRDELGFEGYVTSDWEGVEMLHEHHRTARTLEAAVRQAYQAGLDVASVGGVRHAERLRRLVEADEISDARLDESVRRVLALKFRLGLFDDPYVDVDRAVERVGLEEHRELATQAARRSLTLLKNEGVLPLSPDLDEVLVTGPNADSLEHQLGGWTSSAPAVDGVTIREGIDAVVSDETTVTYEEGAGISERADVEAAADLAVDADAAVVVLGEDAYIHEFISTDMTAENTGRFPTRSQLSLPTGQAALLQSVHETGTPTVLVLVTGRPLAVSWAAEHVPGILMAYYPGQHGGQAVAETLFGAHNPSGKLPISVPRSTGHLPTRFNHQRKPWVLDEASFPPAYDPLFAFGHGESYTEFEHHGPELSATEIPPDGTVHVDLTVANVGARAGRETIDVFYEDTVSSRVTPTKEHVGFASAHVPAGGRETVSVTIDGAELGVVHPDGRRVTEPGEFELTAGQQTARLRVVD